MSDDPVLHQRELADGRTGQVYPITYGRARLGVGTGAYVYDDVW